LAQRGIVSSLHLRKQGDRFRFVSRRLEKFAQIFSVDSKDHDWVPLQASRHSQKYVRQHALELQLAHGGLLPVGEFVKDLPCKFADSPKSAKVIPRI
jgi:hypothetical protein